MRHLAPDQLWSHLREPTALLNGATQFHPRPFNGHHAQLPALTATGRRAPEYRHWGDYAAALPALECVRFTRAPLLIVVKLGHAAPAYRLASFPDTWRDARVVAADLRRLWRATV